MLTIEFIPFERIRTLPSVTKINKLLRIAKENKIVLLEGRLSKEEEAELIRVTMEEIDNEFKGIELAVIHPQQQEKMMFIQKMRLEIAKLLLGNRTGFTIIGPATIVKEIKQDPNKIQLLTEDISKKHPSK
ncbi:MAG: DUF2073 domain-containing protein [Candidatus Woesearchaeota archaeon]